MHHAEFTEPFTVSGAIRRGATRARMRAPDLARPFRGVRVPAAIDGFDSRCAAFALHRERPYLFSHATAAELYGVPLPRRADASIHVSVPGDERAPSVAGFTAHTLARWVPAVRAGLPVTTPEQTWLDLAAVVDRVALIAAGDFLVSGDAPLTTTEELREIVAASRGRRGVARARHAVEHVRTGVESPGESRLRLLLTDAGLPEPTINLPVQSEQGRFIARVDLAYPAARLALEYEGDYHRVQRAVWQKDIRRREELEDAGWRMVRVTASDLAHPALLVARILRLTADRRPP